jgi:hypothetical protein
MNKTHLRQGDVLFREVERLPGNIKPREERILARGEFSDHSQVVYGEQARVHRSLEGELYVDTRKGAAIIRHVLESRHKQGVQQWAGEHRTLMLPKGRIYQVRQQREYDPYQQRNRQVID